MILDGHQSSHRANDERVFRHAQFLAHRGAHFLARRKALRIDAVVHYTEALRTNPCLARMKIAQLTSDGENRIRHGVGSAAKKTAAHRQAHEHVDFISVLAVNNHGNARQPRRRHSLERAPIARVHNVRAVFAHNARQPENRELQFEFGAAGNEHLFLGEGRPHEVGIETPCRTDAVLELLAKPGDQFQNAHLGAAAAHAADHMQNTQATGSFRSRPGVDSVRSDIAIHLSLGLHLVRIRTNLPCEP
jgi:hypothetical protein